MNKKEGQKKRYEDDYYKVTRAQVFEVFVDDPDKTGLVRRIFASIDLYRATARKMFSAIAMAMATGATITTKKGNLTLTPKKGFKGSAKKILELAYGVVGYKADAYELRDFANKEEMPTVLSYVWTSCKDEVVGTWKHPDPEFSTKKKTITRGWLTLQGSRAFARFRKIGIGMPRLTAKPKFMEKSIIVKWDHSIGPVEFHVKSSLPNNMFWKFKNLRDDVWRPGTMYLGSNYKNGSDGQKHRYLTLTVTYKMPEKVVEDFKNRVMYVEFTDDPECAITMYCDEKFHYSDKIDVTEARAWNKELAILTSKFKDQRASVGSKFNNWGSRKILKVINGRSENITNRKLNGKKEKNHLWTRRIISNAQSWGCGHIIILNLPSKLLCGMEWQLSQFESILRYKVEDELKGQLTTILAKAPEKETSGDAVFATPDDKKVAVQIETEVV